MDSAAHPTIAAGIVNFRCARETARCLRSLLAQSTPCREIVVLDNASGDGSVDFLRREFTAEPTIRIIESEENRGFAAGQNQAIRVTAGEFYLCLNPDAILRPDYVEKLVGALRARPECGYATGLIYFCDAAGEPLPFIFSAGHDWLRARYALNRFWKQSAPEDQLVSCEVGGASGCALMFRRTMLDQIDLGSGEWFDETYFMYNEDVDMDWRAHLAGWKCWFEREAVALHEAEITGGPGNPLIRGTRVSNRWLMILKNDCPGNFLLHLPYMVKADLTWFLPDLSKCPGAVLACFGGLGRRTAQAWRKRRAVRKATTATPKEIREWMRRSLVDFRAIKRRQFERMPDGE